MAFVRHNKRNVMICYVNTLQLD